MAGRVHRQAVASKLRAVEIALKILQGAAVAAAPPVMAAGAPTITQGGNGVRSTFLKDAQGVGQSVYTPSRTFGDPNKTTPVHSVMTPSGFPQWVDRGAFPAFSIGRANGNGQRFYLTGKFVEFAVEATKGGVHRVQMKVDGQLIGANDVVVGDDRVIYLTFSWPTVARRLIEVFFTNSDSIKGYNIAPDAVIEPAPLVGQVRAMFMCDSYGEITGTNRNLDVMPYKAAEVLGLDAMVTSPSSGTSYYERGTAKSYFERRYDVLRAGELDYLGIWGGINGRNVDPGLEGGNAAMLYAYARDAQPRALIQVFGPTNASSYKVSPAHVATNKAAFLSVADLDRMDWVDTSGWITGTGNITNLKGDGNADLYMGPDGLHYAAPGHAYIGGQRVPAAVLDFCRRVAYGG